MMRDGNFRFAVALMALVALMLVALGPTAARAYDEKRCKKSVERLKKHIKSYRGLKIKTLYKQIDKVDEKEGGWDEKELEAAIEPPFEDLSWTKKFIKYMNNLEKYCTK